MARIKYKPRNLFADETNIHLIRFITGREVKLAGNVNTQKELARVIHQRLRPWLLSFLLHAAVVILLACFFLPQIRFEKIDILSATLNAPALKEPVIVQERLQGDNTKDNEHPAAVSPKAAEEPEPLSPQAGFAPPSIFNRQRSTAGSGQNDAAVAAGLNWLVKVQNAGGSWSLSSTKYTLSAAKTREDVNAATAMALLAFLGYGITTDAKTGEAAFVKAVTDAWDYLRRQQNPSTGCFFSDDSPNTSHRFYTHALCTAALCELYAATQDKTLQKPSHDAVEYCLRHQSLDGGGWRYLPDRFSPQSDVSVTGWIVLALKSGESAGLTVPPAVYQKVSFFLDRMKRRNQYQYRTEEPELRLPMTAEALFCRILLGWHRDDDRLTAGVQYLMETPPAFDDHYRRDAYYWFFATNVLYHYGGEHWNVWHKTMREVLLQHQEKAGADGGSWNPRQPVRDAWGTQYGRLYTTCFSLFILEVPYRYKRIGD
ncbi:MAG: terpene cyclase/mutase family protein [Planctomycetaceae bacterium]|jgi:hypothetical protein|nr:terpene cyclase/mutase family protein [Planctomycetaceae bacterium]